MPLSYSKWDNIDDSDDEDDRRVAASKPTSTGDHDPAMDAFLGLGRDASVAQIQEKIKGMSAETRDALLRHEKGGLLKRVLELDPNKSYEAGEIFGTAAKPAPPPSAKPPAPPAEKKKPALKPTPKPKSPFAAPAAKKIVADPPAPAPAPKAAEKKKIAIVDESSGDPEEEEDDGPRIVDITDEPPAAAKPPPAKPPAVASAPVASAAPASVAAPAPPPPLTTVTATSASSGGNDPRSFTFVRLPADVTQPIESQIGFDLPGGDTLPMLLAPMFQSSLKLDEHDFKLQMAAAVEQAKETAAKQQPKAKVGAVGENESGPNPAPTLADLENHSSKGVCEAWPLASASLENGWLAVKLYIDEVGALRKRPRNPRAEALATASGQLGLAIHGDAYVGRLHLGAKWGEENNLDFAVEELDPSAAWLKEARTLRENERERRGYDANAQVDKSSAQPPTFTSGTDAENPVDPRYTWSQDGESVEVRVLKGVPTGANAKHRVKVSYGAGGDALKVVVDKKETILEVSPLFARVQPFECSWSLDGKVLCVNLEKCDAKPWLDLTKPLERDTEAATAPAKAPAPEAAPLLKALAAAKEECLKPAPPAKADPQSAKAKPEDFQDGPYPSQLAIDELRRKRMEAAAPEAAAEDASQAVDEQVASLNKILDSLPGGVPNGCDACKPEGSGQPRTRHEH